MIKKGIVRFGIALVSGTVIGCGGGGSGSDSEPACRSYCNYGCQRTADCGYVGQASVRTCTDTCIVRTRDNANSELGCSQAEELLRDASCAEIGRLLNLRMHEPKLSTEPHSGTNNVEPAGLSEHVGSELGICDVEALADRVAPSNP